MLHFLSWLSLQIRPIGDKRLKKVIDAAINLHLDWADSWNAEHGFAFMSGV